MLHDAKITVKDDYGHIRTVLIVELDSEETLHDQVRVIHRAVTVWARDAGINSIFCECFAWYTNDIYMSFGIASGIVPSGVWQSVRTGG